MFEKNVAETAETAEALTSSVSMLEEVCYDSSLRLFFLVFVYSF